MAGLELIITPGISDLTGEASTIGDLAATLATVDRAALVRYSIRIMNILAADRRTGVATADQAGFVAVLPPGLRARYESFVKSAGTSVRLLHPAQQLVLVHAAARYGAFERGLTLDDPAARTAWALACLQINDHLMKQPVPPSGLSSWDKALYLFSEDAGRWELGNPSRPDKSLARTRVLFRHVPQQSPDRFEAAERLRKMFVDQLGLDFDTAYNLTAFLIYHWVGESTNLGARSDFPSVNRQTWLQNSTIPLERFDRYLSRIAMRLEEIVPTFDGHGVGMSFRDVLPFRRRPLFRIDDDAVAFLAPQFMSEKGGVDLLWLLTNEPGGGKEPRMFTDDFSLLYEGYVQLVLEALGSRLGGEYVADIAFAGEDGSGQIDGLVKAGNLLAVLEVKASLVRAPLLAGGATDKVRSDLETKFVGGPGARKGLSQLVHAIHWLAAERRAGRLVHGLNLKSVDSILPVLIVADRHLRYPGLGEWFDHSLQQMLRPVWAHVGPVTICGTEDLETMEHLAIKGNARFMDILANYSRRAKRAKQPLWTYYDAPKGPHPRLDGIFKEWMAELVEQKIMLR